VQSDARRISRIALSRRLQQRQEQLWQLPVPVSGSEDTAAAAYYCIRIQYNIISVQRPRGEEIRVIQLLYCYIYTTKSTVAATVVMTLVWITVPCRTRSGGGETKVVRL